MMVLVDPYTLGRFQSEGVARTWRGTARLPTQEQMWREYPRAGNEIRWHPTDASGERHCDNRIQKKKKRIVALNKRKIF